MRLILVKSCFLGIVLTLNISTKPQTFNVKEMGMVELPCHIQPESDEYSVVWSRGSADDVLFVDEEKLTEDSRFEVTKENNKYTLTINGAEPIDGADYICEVFENDNSNKIAHKVVVVVPPQLHISPDTSPLMVTRGDDVVLRCTGSGNPIPKVKWSKKSGHMPANVEVKGNHLRFEASSEHSGEYICTGTNSASTTTRTIELQVAEIDKSEAPHKPWTKTELSYIPVGRGDSVNVSCQYDGNPAPQVEWLHNGHKINFGSSEMHLWDAAVQLNPTTASDSWLSDAALADKLFDSIQQLGQREQNYSVTTLVITDLNEDLFGDYMCRITNGLGSDLRVVHVSGKPGPPVVTVDGTQITWSVQSKEPVVEYAIHYRSSNEDAFTHKEYVRADKRDQTGANEYTNSINLLPYVKRGETYHVQVEARNSVGWGSMARTYSTVVVPMGEPVVASASSLIFMSTVAAVLLSFF